MSTVTSKFNISEIFTRLKEQLALDDDGSHEPYMPDIIQFCDSKKYLNLLGHGIKLFPMQRIILKTFYRKQRGNEYLSLTEDELHLMKKYKLNNAIEKYYSDSLFKELVLVLGRRCLSEDSTMIDPNTGREWSLGEMWDYGKTEGIMSWTFDERTKDMKIIPNCNLIFQGSRPVYRLQTSSGHEIETTDNHPLMTQQGWVELKNLDINTHKVALVESQPFFGDSGVITEDEAAILGYMTGDGNCSQSATFFTCSNNEILEDFTKRIDHISDNLKVFNDPWTGAKSKQYQYKITCRDRLQEKYYNNKTQKVMSKLSKTDLQKLLIKHGLMGKTCHHKVAPRLLFECPKNVIATYLRALYSCDGSIHKHKNQITIAFTTVNKEQAIAVQKLLSRFSIIAHLRRRQQKTTVNGRSYDSVSYEVYFKKTTYIELFLQSIGFVGKKTPKITSRRSRKSHVISFVAIRSITSLGNKRTFDLQVSDNPNEQNFTINNIICHNSGKDFMVSLIALYESMKLLESPGGCPAKYYGIAPGNPIYILTVATSADQAKILFTEIKTKLEMSDYFCNKVGHTDADRIWLLTPEDKRRNKELIKNGLKPTKGTVCIMSGHSNSDALLGKGYYCLLFDEVASFKTIGLQSGERLYSALGPGISAFNKPVFLEDGKRTVSPKDKSKAKILYDQLGDQVRQLDSKIISISSPRSEEGIFYKLYTAAPEEPSRLVFRLPTWKVNLGITEQMLRDENRYMSAMSFQMEFGAEFSGTAGEKYIPNSYVDDAIKLGSEFGLSQRLTGYPGAVYYAHLDPASTSHNYALVVLHVEDRIQIKEKENGVKVKERVKIYVIDHMKIWQPGIGVAINVYQVDKYVIDLAKRFRFAMVSYDNWNSLASVQKLRSKGIPCKVTPFRKQYKMAIYDQLEHLLVNHQLALPPKGPAAHQMEMELKCLKRIYSPNGFKIQPDPEGQVTTDDMCDSLAGACGVAMEQTYSGYARGGTVNVPQFRSGDQMWNIGHGSYSTSDWRYLSRKFGKL